MKLREQLIDANIKYFKGQIEKHRMNVEVYLKNPAGIGEHSDIMEAIEGELSQMAEYDDKLEMLDKYFGDQ
jgi:hypothetical protein